MNLDLCVVVDIEASGLIPGDYSMLSIGAVDLKDDREFYAELKPLNDKSMPGALEVCGFELEAQERLGSDPKQVMQDFCDWAGGGRVFVAYNAPFDFAFINWYTYHFLGGNPFCYIPVDILGYYGSKHGLFPTEALGEIPLSLPHHALLDAKIEAELFRELNK